MLYSCIAPVCVNDIYVDLCKLLSLGCALTDIFNVIDIPSRHSPTEQGLERDSLFEVERLTVPEESIDGFGHSTSIGDRLCCH